MKVTQERDNQLFYLNMNMKPNWQELQLKSFEMEIIQSNKYLFLNFFYIGFYKLHSGISYSKYIHISNIVLKMSINFDQKCRLQKNYYYDL